MSLCAYFEQDPNEPGLVSQFPHDAEPSLHFYVPNRGVAAVRVPVCRPHCQLLESLFGGEHA